MVSKQLYRDNRKITQQILKNLIFLQSMHVFNASSVVRLKQLSYVTCALRLRKILNFSQFWFQYMFYISAH